MTSDGKAPSILRTIFPAENTGVGHREYVNKGYCGLQNSWWRCPGCDTPIQTPGDHLRAVWPCLDG